MGRRISRGVLLGAVTSLAAIAGCSSSGTKTTGAAGKVAVYYFNALGSVESAADALGHVDDVFYAFWGAAADGHLLMTRPDLDLDGAPSPIQPVTPIEMPEVIQRFPESTGYLKQACALKAASPNLRVSLSIGGWGGGNTFSGAFASGTGRAAFIADVALLVTSLPCGNGQQLFSGIDLDWEYPKVVVAGTPETVSPEDAAHLHSLIIALREALGPAAHISIAMPHGNPGTSMAEVDNNDVPGDGGSIGNYFTAANGALLEDTKQFIAATTVFNLMTYDFMAFALQTTPNAPMRLDAKTGLPDMVGGLASIESYGVPPHKVYLGAPLYGRTIGAKYTDAEWCLQSQPQAATHGVGVVLPDFSQKSPYGEQAPCSINWPLYNEINVAELGKNAAFDMGLEGSDQIMVYWYGVDPSLNKASVVFKSGTGPQTALASYRDVFMSFDGPNTIAAKAHYAAEHGLRGIAFWAALQDVPYDSGTITIAGVEYPMSLVRTAVETLK